MVWRKYKWKHNSRRYQRSALYTKGGTVNVASSSTLKIGNSDAVGVFTTGKKWSNVIVNSTGKYDMRKKSYRIVNIGTGNTTNVTSGTVWKLTRKGKFHIFVWYKRNNNKCC